MPTMNVTPGTGQAVELPNANGRVAAASSRPVTLSTEDKAVLDLIATAANQASQTTLIGSVTETAPASDTASSGLNGRLQRIAQRLTALFGTAGSASANVLSVQGIASGTNLPVVSNNSEVKLSVSFTRPANTTAYAAGDLVANDTAFGSVTPLAFSNAVRTAGDCVRIDRARIFKSNTVLTNASFRLHLFEAIPVPSVGDNAAFNSSSALATTGALTYLGSIPITAGNSCSDGANGSGVPSVGTAITCAPSSGTTIYGLLEVTAAYTPTSSETFTVILEGFRT